MILFTMSSLLRMQEQRPPGYVDDVLSKGVVLTSADGTVQAVQLTREAYESLKAKYRDPSPVSLASQVPHRRPSGCPGSWLKWLLAKLLKQVASPNCSCNARAAQMDQWGCRACLWNLGTIIGWLGEEAGKRKLRFSRIGAGCLILAAISLAAGEWAYRKCRLAGNRK